AYDFKHPVIAGLLFYFASFANNFYVYKLILLVFFLSCFMIALYLIYGLKRHKKEWIFVFLLAPSFILFSANSWDSIASIFVLISVLASIYGFHALSGFFVGLSSCLSFYPLMILPALYLSNNKRDRERILEAFVSTFVVVNTPMFMINRDRWIRSYTDNALNFICDFSLLKLLKINPPFGINVLILIVLIFSIAYACLMLKRGDLVHLSLRSIILLSLVSFSLSPLVSLWMLPILALTSLNPGYFLAFDVLNVLVSLNLLSGSSLVPLAIMREVALLALFFSISKAEKPVFSGRDKFVKMMSLVNNGLSKIKSLLGEKVDLTTTGLLGLISFLLLAYRLWEPDKIYFDEIYYVDQGARCILNGTGDKNWIHPPLGKELIALGIKIFSDTPFAWRIIGVILASLATPAVYLISIKMFRSRKIALLSSIFLLLDPLYYAQSRIAMLDVYVFAFSTIAVLFYVYYSFSERKRVFLYLSGIFFGLAISSKLPGILPYFLCGTGLLVDSIRNRDFRELCHVLVAYLLIPIVIYVLSYVPTLFIRGLGFKDFLETQNWMIRYSAWLPPKKPHPYRSQPWEWPLIMRPLLSLYDVTVKEGRTYVSSISDIGNPITWFGGLIAFSTIMVDVIKKREGLAFLVSWFLITWLPYFPMGIMLYYGAGREMFIYYFLQCLPPLMIMFARELKGFDDYLGFNFSLFVILILIPFYVICYPVISGLLIPKEYLDGMKILKL
ncbi:hypothetical protein DRN86_05245, partial [Candidatus Geothermarchaeota archaeon]